jgi:opacity protein-like surface antigen
VKKLSALIAIMAVLFAVNSLNAQTYPVPKVALHIYGGYTLPLPDLKGVFPDDITSGKNPTPYFMKSGFNFGANGKYFVDKKSTFGIMLSLTYTMLSSGDIGTTSTDTNSFIGTGTWKFKMNVFTIGVGAEYDFAPKRPANPFLNACFTTNIIGGNVAFTPTNAGTTAISEDMTSAVRFGVRFGAGVDVKLSKKIGVIIGGSYHMLNLFGKDSTGNTSTNYGLNDKETTTMKAKKIVDLSFYAGISFYLGQKTTKVVKK